MKNWSLLMWVYLIFAILGLVIPWYYNLSYILNSEIPISVQAYIDAGFASPLAGSLTSDLLIGSTPVLIWMMIEGKRLQMKNVWVYFIATFMVAFAFSCPLFLFMRERKLNATK